jgi:membrane associated rhomboid family serine protease
VIPISDDNPVRRTPVITYVLIGLCTAVFLWQLSLGEIGFRRAIYAFGVIPAVLTEQAALPPALSIVPPPVTVMTSMFMHGGVMHLLGNLLYLWIFADNVEDRLGRFRFVVFYLLCGIAAAMAQVLPDTASEVPMIGASGAISGVLGAYLLLHPHARVLVVVPVFFVLQILRMPAVLVLGLWFLIQLISSLAAEPGAGGVAFRAHLGGFVAGLVLLPLIVPRRRVAR